MKRTKVRMPTPVAREMVTSGLYRSRQVPNRKRQASRLACRRTDAQADRDS